MRKVFLITLILVGATGVLTWWNGNRVPTHLAIAPRITVPSPPTIAFSIPKRALALHRGERLGQIEIPRLGLSVPVFEGDDPAILDLGAGHVPGTALPGDSGNICIAAHRDKFFRALRFIKPHDEIVLQTGDGESRYIVNSTQIINPSDTQVLMPAPNRDLTLVTCYPFFYVGSAPHRFIVHAVRESSTNS
jgi:sortase A